MAPVGLFLLLYLTSSVIARKPPRDVSCRLVDLDYVHCSWNGQDTPEVNYTFYSRFNSDNNFQECTFYTSENGSTTGCKQQYKLLQTLRFHLFYTKLTYDNGSFPQKEHNLKSEVKLYPPVNMTVKNDSNNLCFYWNHTNGWYQCLENEIRYRTNYNKWESSRFSRQSHCTNLPSNNSRYELQVRFKVASHCGESKYWSDWSQLVWGSMKSKDTQRPSGPMSAWSVVCTVVGTCIFLLLLITLVHHDRIRIILIPVVPKPGKNLNEILIHGNVEEWLHISKGLKEGFKADYNEPACAVIEYSRVPQSASESSDSSSSSSVTTDQTDCSVATSANEE